MESCISRPSVYSLKVTYRPPSSNARIKIPAYGIIVNSSQLGEISYYYKLQMKSFVFCPENLYRIANGFVYLMQMYTAHRSVTCKLCTPPTVAVILCSVHWGDCILSCIFMCLCADIQELD